MKNTITTLYIAIYFLICHAVWHYVRVTDCKPNNEKTRHNQPMLFECIFHCKRLKYTWSTNPKSNKAIFYIKMEKYILLGCALWHSGKIMHAWHAYYYTALKHIVDLIMIIIIDFLKSSNNPNVLVCYLYQLGSIPLIPIFLWTKKCTKK